MKQFNLTEYLANPSRKVVTRDGRQVRIICTDRKDPNYVIVGLATDGEYECIYAYIANGMHDLMGDSDSDLFFAPEIHESWVNVYRKSNGDIFTGERVYETEEAAVQGAWLGNKEGSCTKMGAVKITWEE